MQLLKITTVPIKYKVEQENVVSESDQSFNLNLEKNMSNVKIPVQGSEKSQSHNEKMVDRSNFRSGAVQRINSDSSVNETGQSVSENDYDVKYFYGKKNVSSEKSANTTALNMQNYTAASIDAAINSIDSVLPDSSWEPDLNTNANNSEHKVSQVHHKAVKEHHPKKVVEEFAHVEIEYLGGFNYVPKSSAPDYEDPEEK